MTLLLYRSSLVARRIVCERSNKEQELNQGDKLEW